MGIYDRDYYRDDAAGGWSDWRGVRVTLGLIALIVVPFLAELFLTPAPRRGFDDAPAAGPARGRRHAGC